MLPEIKQIRLFLCSKPRRREKHQPEYIRVGHVYIWMGNAIYFIPSNDRR
jgi:hypothetical protein